MINIKFDKEAADALLYVGEIYYDLLDDEQSLEYTVVATRLKFELPLLMKLDSDMVFDSKKDLVVLEEMIKSSIDMQREMLDEHLSEDDMEVVKVAAETICGLYGALDEIADFI